MRAHHAVPDPELLMLERAARPAHRLRHLLTVIVAAVVVVTLIAVLAPPAFAGEKVKQVKVKAKDEVAETDGVGFVASTDSVETDDDLDEAGGPGALRTVAEQIGAAQLWDEGYTGEGVHVAVIDTGVAPVPALTGADKVVAMVDLSFEAGIPEAVYLDTFGHGTHMAGIIAGRSPGVDLDDLNDLDDDEFVGIAPGAGIVSVKVGDNTGAVDVSQVIAGIDWVVQHKDAEGMNIRVLNLSYGTDSNQPYEIDPLAAAVERAWDAGIVVVVAAGNDGRPEKGLGNPARDPLVIAVGAADIDSDGKVKAAKFSTSGDGDRNPDVIAPGVSIESLRVPGSRLDAEHPEGRVDDELLFKGSGSSQAAAVVSGAVALLLDARPELTPDQVKDLLIRTAAASDSNAKFAGQGLVDIDRAVEARARGKKARQDDVKRSDGSGSLEAARGDHHVVIDGVELTGEVIWTGASWTGASWTGASWTGASWTGASWTGASWLGASWTGASWTGASWLGASWTGASWTGASWLGASWLGASWTGASWTGASWTGASWTGASWTGASWTGASWTDAAWS